MIYKNIVTGVASRASLSTKNWSLLGDRSRYLFIFYCPFST